MKKDNTVKKSARKRKEIHRKRTVGIDLGDRSSRYCILDEQGEVLAEGSVATTPKGFALGEPTFGGVGHEVIVATPRRVRLSQTAAARTIGWMRRHWHGYAD
jgi:transposase